MRRKKDDYKVKDCYEVIKPHIGHAVVRPGFVMTSSGTIERFPQDPEDRRDFFQNNLEV